ncbi:MAG: protein phosphatase CheZ [Betaproteobacteria bacterium]|nr:protein phosphatase CheZ [Betaproteobacteria bacterium]
MANPIKFDESSDSEDLQSLFDSIAAVSEAPMLEPKAPAPAVDASGSGDSDDLQALFDNVASNVAAPAAAVAAPPQKQAGAGEPGDVFSSLGHLAREFHDSLRELGHDKALGDAARTIPDARQRLTYIVQMTEQAATRALNAIEIAKPIQDTLENQAGALGTRWEKVFANQLSASDFKALAADTQAFLRAVPQQSRATNAQLTEIMMAQDFQDLTGQVIKKVVELVANMETQLLKVLLVAKPPDMHVEAPDGLLNGPVINAAGRSDIVNSQSQVDDMLESLGF